MFEGVLCRHYLGVGYRVERHGNSRNVGLPEREELLATLPFHLAGVLIPQVASNQPSIM